MVFMAQHNLSVSLVSVMEYNGESAALLWEKKCAVFFDFETEYWWKPVGIDLQEQKTIISDVAMKRQTQYFTSIFA